MGKREKGTEIIDSFPLTSLLSVSPITTSTKEKVTRIHYPQSLPTSYGLIFISLSLSFPFTYLPALNSREGT